MWTFCSFGGRSRGFIVGEGHRRLSSPVFSVSWKETPATPDVLSTEGSGPVQPGTSLPTLHSTPVSCPLFFSLRGKLVPVFSVTEGYGSGRDVLE